MRLFILSRAGAQHTRQRSGCSESPLRKRPVSRDRQRGRPASGGVGSQPNSRRKKWVGERRVAAFHRQLAVGWVYQKQVRGSQRLADSRLSKKYIDEGAKIWQNCCTKLFFLGGGGCTKTKHNQRKFRQQMQDFSWCSTLIKSKIVTLAMCWQITHLFKPKKTNLLLTIENFKVKLWRPLCLITLLHDYLHLEPLASSPCKRTVAKGQRSTLTS